MAWRKETPVYAEEVNAIGRFKVSKNNERDACVRLRFLDFVSKNVVADVILNFRTLLLDYMFLSKLFYI